MVGVPSLGYLLATVTDSSSALISDMIARYPFQDEIAHGVNAVRLVARSPLLISDNTRTNCYHLDDK